MIGHLFSIPVILSILYSYICTKHLTLFCNYVLCSYVLSSYVPVLQLLVTCISLVTVRVQYIRSPDILIVVCMFPLWASVIMFSMCFNVKN